MMVIFGKLSQYVQFVNLVQLTDKRAKPKAAFSQLNMHKPYYCSLSACRQVSKSEGSSLAAQHECAFFESSAAEEYVVVQNVFHAAVRDVIRERVSHCSS